MSHLPVADPLVLITCTVISVDDGLLRTSTGCAGPLFSSTLYTDWLKLTVTTMERTKIHSCTYNLRDNSKMIDTHIFLHSIP